MNKFKEWFLKWSSRRCQVCGGRSFLPFWFLWRYGSPEDEEPIYLHEGSCDKEFARREELAKIPKPKS